MFIPRPVLGTLANSSAPLLSPKSVHLIFKIASGISRMCLISKINSLRGSSSQAAVVSAIYSASGVERAISD